MATLTIERRASFGWPAFTDYAPCANGMVAHYNGGPTGLSEDNPHSACREYWQNTRHSHITGNGWRDIGYSFMVCPHGVILEGRGAQRVQAAQPGGNTTWTSCTFGIGGSEVPSTRAINAWLTLRAWLRSNYGVGSAVRPHSDFISTDCPGPIVRHLITTGILSGPLIPTIPERDTMETVVHLGTKVQQLVPPGETRSITFELEYADPGAIHTDAQPSIFPKNSAPVPHLWTVELDTSADYVDSRDLTLAFASYERGADVHVDNLRENDIGAQRHSTTSGLITMDNGYKYRVDLINHGEEEVVVYRCFLYVTR